MSRRPKKELEFGSDSFLDVICNIVGILIILIVLAGVRVSRAPVLLRVTPTMMDTLPTVVSVESAPAIEPLLPDVAPVEEPVVGVAPPESAEPPADLVAEAERLTDEVGSLNNEYQQTVQRLTSAHEQQQLLEERLQRARLLLEKRSNDATALAEQVASTTAAIAQLEQMAQKLEEQLRAQQQQPTSTKAISHRITPIGRQVTGKELHFRVEGNRVAVVPLERLLLRVKEQIERRKDWLAKSHSHQGQVGPLDGFTISYTVQRDALSVVDELRYGQGVYRISVREWELKPSIEVAAETAQQALASGSRFMQAILESGDDTTCTFWVYPDSFDAYGKLKEFCHQQNFYVAARPLPPGIPIAGSPTGTKSSGQ